MLNNLIEDKQFGSIMENSMQELILHFFDKEQHFGVLCSIENVSFDPVLPENINSEFRDLTLFFLGGYTFETAEIEDGYLRFEAGFGSENIGSIVTIPLLSIIQISVDNTPILINVAKYQEMDEEELNFKEKMIDSSGVKNSMASFLSNPENSKFIK